MAKRAVVTNLVWAPPSLIPGRATDEVPTSFTAWGSMSIMVVPKPALSRAATAMSSMASRRCLPSRAAISPMV